MGEIGDSPDTCGDSPGVHFRDHAVAYLYTIAWSPKCTSGLSPIPYPLPRERS